MEDAVRARVDAADRRRKRKVQTRDPFGRETGTWEEEEEDGIAASDAAPAVPRTMTADEARPIRDAAWREYVRDLENGWKSR